MVLWPTRRGARIFPAYMGHTGNSWVGFIRAVFVVVIDFTGLRGFKGPRGRLEKEVGRKTSTGLERYFGSMELAASSNGGCGGFLFHDARVRTLLYKCRVFDGSCPRLDRFFVSNNSCP